MGGEGSGRKPDPIKKLIGMNQPTNPKVSPSLFIPNLSGVKQEIKEGTHNISINDIPDVDATNRADNRILVYNAATGNMEYEDPGAATETDPYWSAQSAALWTEVGNVEASAAINTASCATISAILNPHVSSSAIHFTSAAIWSAINTTSSAYITHAASSAIHFDSVALWSSMASISSVANVHVASAAIHFNSVAIWSSMAGVVKSANDTSSAYFTHAADSTDPHGTLLTQTSMAIVGDHVGSTAALVVPVIMAPSATPPTASGFPQGTIFLQYTA